MSGQQSFQSIRVVIVTGAGTGIGRAIASRLLKDGFLCVLAGPYEAEMEETIELSGVSAERSAVVVCDVRKSDDRERLVESAAALPGNLYGLVNNAGITRLAPLLQESLSEWRDTIETNLEASYFLSQAAICRMRDHGDGRIVNVASIHGMVGRNPRLWDVGASDVLWQGDGPVRESAYAASKGGLLQLTRDLASAVGRWGINVNAVSPGVVPHPVDELERRLANPDRGGLAGKVDHQASEATREAVEQVERKLADRVPLGRLGRVHEIAGPVSFLLSLDATYVTGANLVADGGWSIW